MHVHAWVARLLIYFFIFPYKGWYFQVATFIDVIIIVS